MTAVTLSWEDPEAASDFLRLREEYRRFGWLPDPSVARLLELVRDSEIKDGTEDDGGSGG